jgi:ribonuclease III
VDGSLEPFAEDREIMTEGQPELSALEARIGHEFAARSLIIAALTHVSATVNARRESYQRLEFLGDRVLGLVVTDMLYRAFPDADEGELSRRLADLVRKESCAEVARDWGAQAFVRSGENEKHASGLNLAILGDICESIIGAVFLDAGYDAAKAVVTRTFEPRMREARRALRDPKTALQEWAQARGLPPPLYRETARSGPDHAPEFTVSVELPGFREAEAKGLAKKLAEQAAASVFMAREKISDSSVQKGAS